MARSCAVRASCANASELVRVVAERVTRPLLGLVDDPKHRLSQLVEGSALVVVDNHLVEATRRQRILNFFARTRHPTRYLRLPLSASLGEPLPQRAEGGRGHPYAIWLQIRAGDDGLDSLDVDVEHANLAFVGHLLHSCHGRAIALAANSRPLDELAPLDHLIELCRRGEVVVDAVHLASPRVASGRRDREAEPTGLGLEQLRNQRRLAYARRACEYKLPGRRLDQLTLLLRRRLLLGTARLLKRAHRKPDGAARYTADRHLVIWHIEALEVRDPRDHLLGEERRLVREKAQRRTQKGLPRQNRQATKLHTPSRGELARGQSRHEKNGDEQSPARGDRKSPGRRRGAGAEAIDLRGQEREVGAARGRPERKCACAVEPDERQAEGRAKDTHEGSLA
eukprot:scaffold6500_cov109-Isochrysis_galbana.AAC.1